MPGILPMKVIKVGTSSQSRIAQACDRCRSKKIRCDGIRPTCSQCANVGFECRTSDKLSRRAFPRGYTESLEERVRVLEGEVRDLKDLLDEKDEKIDMLSKMHGNRGSSFGHHSSTASSPSACHSDRPRKDSPSTAPPPKEDTFRVQASPLLLGVENSDSYFMGASSGRAFIETLKRRMQESGKSCSDFNPEAFLHIQGCYPLTAESPSSSKRIPPRLFSDRCVNAYFQEWAPLFPVVHKPSFLRLYEEFVGEPEKVKNNHKLAQLYLVFCISALSNDQPELEQIAACEKQWQRALEAVLMDNTIVTLQCLVLAMMYCMLRADYKRLQHYKGVAVGLSHRLGLHQSQKRFSFGALTIETRKKVFWTLYTLDCFSAGILGLPKLLKEEDIHAEYPSDTDDEYVTEKGFQPTLPGEYTRLSSALALFRGARILAKVLERNYPAATSHELSLQSMASMEAELDEWNDELPNHLKLTFKQDKPSTDVTGSRSPLLALAYYYTKILIFRPAIGSSLGSKAAPAVFAVGESSKHLIQIVQLLEERNMAFAFCLNRSDLLINCGMSLLYQGLDLKKDSMIAKDGGRLVNAVVKICDQVKAPGHIDFRRIASTIITVDEPTSPKPSVPVTVPARRRDSSGSEGNMAAPPRRASPPTTSAPIQRASGQIHDHRQQSNLHPLGRHYSKVASASETDLLLQQEKLRRMTMPNANTTHTNNRQSTNRSHSRSSFDGAVRPHQDILPNGTPTAARQREHRLSMSAAQMLARVAPPPVQRSPSLTHAQSQSLDYLSLDSTSPTSQPPSSPVQVRALSHQLQQRQQLAQQQRRQQEQQQLLTPAQLAQKFSASGTTAGVSTAEWEALLGSMEGGSLNVYDSIYGGPGLAALGASSSAETLTPTSSTPPVSALSVSSGRGAWSPDPWDLSSFPIGGGAGGLDCLASGAALSVLSLSDESLSCSSGGEDLSGLPLSTDGLEIDLGLELDLDYRNALAAAAAGQSAEAYLLDGLEGTFGI